MKIIRATRILSAVGILLSHAAAADVVRHKSIPAALLGTWAPHGDDCKADKSVIVLSAESYVSSEVSCTVEWVAETPGGRGPIYSAHMLCSGKAENPQRRVLNLVLLPRDANQISVGADFSSLKTFQRCPME